MFLPGSAGTEQNFLFSVFFFFHKVEWSSVVDLETFLFTHFLSRVQKDSRSEPWIRTQVSCALDMHPSVSVCDLALGWMLSRTEAPSEVPGSCTREATIWQESLQEHKRAKMLKKLRQGWDYKQKKKKMESSRREQELNSGDDELEETWAEVLAATGELCAAQSEAEP